jgi:glycosyltransferase involved in cell wall biosynthesis
MRIGIDGNEANTTHRVGIGQYAFELLTQFAKLTTENAKVSIYLKNNPNQDLPESSAIWEYTVFGPQKLWTQIALPFRLYTERIKPDVFFTPSHYAPRFSPVPTAISIMDVSYLRFPELFKASDLYQLKRWTAYSAKKAARIFTISNASKSDIIHEYQIEADNVIVTYPGIKPVINHPHEAMDKLQKKFNITGEYFLFVGTLQPRKNIVRLIEAFSMVQKTTKKEKNLQLVIVGKKGWLYEDILAAPKRFAVEEDVIFLDFVADEDLPALYKNAISYVLPSLYEGFGLPVLEAMQYDCPVITSNSSSLPEAGGDAALYVDPENVSDIAEKMHNLMKHENLRQEMIAKGKQQIKKFSWEKTAKETLAVLKELGSQQR